MAIARVSGSHAAQAFNDSSSPRTLGFGGALTPGSLAICLVTTYNPGITLTVVGSVNGPYIDSGVGYVVNGSNRISLWYVPNNAASTAEDVTVTPSASAYVTPSLDEFTGVATVSPVRTTASNTGTGGDATTGVVLASAGDLTVFGGVYESGTYTACSFTQIANIAPGAVAQSLVESYGVGSGFVQEIFQGLGAGLNTWGGIAVTFKEATSGGGGNPWYAFAQQREKVRRTWDKRGVIWTPSYAFAKAA